MNVQFYKSSADVKILDKTKYLEDLSGVNCLLKEQCNLLNPVLILASDLTLSNYAYIEKFKRYYFINNISRLDNNRYEMSLTVDVLMSFKDEIKELNVIGTRSSDKFNYYLRDSAIAIQSNNFPIVRRMSKGLFQSNLITENDYTFALTVINKKKVL